MIAAQNAVIAAESLGIDIPAQERCSTGEVMISNYDREQAEDIETLKPYEAVVIWQK